MKQQIINDRTQIFYWYEENTLIDINEKKEFNYNTSFNNYLTILLLMDFTSLLVTCYIRFICSICILGIYYIAIIFFVHLIRCPPLLL
jgi:hypothetical protein